MTEETKNAGVPATRETEIIAVPIKTDSMLPDIQRIPSPNELVTIIEARNEFIVKALPIVIATTKPGDWVDMGGNPYPTTGACLKIMERFGIGTVNNTLRKVESEDEKGRYYVYIYEADYLLPGFHAYHSVGTCTSRDQFFAVIKDKKTGEKSFKPLYEISEDNIIKAAKSNCDVNGTRGLLGIKSVTWEEIEGCGLKRSEMARVTYGKGAEKNQPAKPAAPTKPEDKKPAAPPAETAAPALNRDELIGEWNMICEFDQATFGADPEDLCKKYFAFSKPNEDGDTYARLDMIQRFKSDRALRWLKAGIEEAKKTIDLAAYSKFKESGGVQAPAGDDIPF